MIAALSTHPIRPQHFMCDFMCAQLLKVKTTPLPWMLTFVVKEKKKITVSCTFLISKHEIERKYINKIGSSYKGQSNDYNTLPNKTPALKMCLLISGKVCNYISAETILHGVLLNQIRLCIHCHLNHFKTAFIKLKIKT